MSDQTKRMELIAEIVVKNQESLKQLNKDIDVYRKASAEAHNASEGLTGAVFKGNFAFGAFAQGLRAVRGAMDGAFKTLKMGGDLDRLNITLDTVATNMGYTIEQFRGAGGFIEQLEATNTWGSNATETLIALTQTGLMPFVQGLKRAGDEREGFELFIGTIKDLAASRGISSGDAIQNMVKAVVMGRGELLESMGVITDLNQVYQQHAETLGKTSMELTNAEKRQALLNTVMAEGVNVAAVYDNTYSTAGKNLLSIQDAMKSTRELLGSAFQESFAMITGGVLDTIKAIRSFIQNNQVAFQSAALVFSSIIQGAISAGAAVVSFIKQHWTLITTLAKVILVVGAVIAAYKTAMLIILGVQMAVKGAVAAFAVMKGALAILTVQLTITQIAAGALAIALLAIAALIGGSLIKKFQGFQNQLKNVGTGIGGVGSAATAATPAIQDFGNSGGDSIGKMADAAKVAEQEIESLQSRIEKATEDFKRQLNDIVDRAEERLRENKKRLADEQKEFEKFNKKRSDDFAEEMRELDNQNNQRMTGLRDFLALGLDETADNYDEQVRLMEERLAAEEKALKEKKKTRVKEYQEETDDIKKEYYERTDELKTKIDEDEKMLENHNEVIKENREEDKRDEIQKLIDTHNEKLQEIQDQYEKEVEEFNNKNDRQLAGQGGANAAMEQMFDDLGAGFGDMTGGMGEDWQLALDDMTSNMDFFSVDLGEIVNGLVEKWALWTDQAAQNTYEFLNGLGIDFSEGFFKIKLMIDDVGTFLNNTFGGAAKTLEDVLKKIGLIKEKTKSSGFASGDGWSGSENFQGNQGSGGGGGSAAGFAEGGTFITSGPRKILVGDNTSGKEQVSITPLDASGQPVSQISNSGGEGKTINFIFNGVTSDEMVQKVRSVLKDENRNFNLGFNSGVS